MAPGLDFLERHLPRDAVAGRRVLEATLPRPIAAELARHRRPIPPGRARAEPPGGGTG